MNDALNSKTLRQDLLTTSTTHKLNRYLELKDTFTVMSLGFKENLILKFTDTKHSKLRMNRQRKYLKEP